MHHAAMQYEALGRLIGRGNSSEVYLRADGAVMKLYAAEAPAALADREEAAAGHAAAAGLPVARPRGRVMVGERTGLLLDHVPGRTLLARTRYRPIGALGALRRLARHHAAIHRERPAAGLPRQRDVLERQIGESAASEEAKALARAALARLPDGDRLCHGDLHPRNVICQGRRITLIDWCKASAGHPCADVARTELLIRYAAHGGTGPHDRLLDGVRDLLGAWYVRCYARAAGVAPGAIAEWRLPLAVAWTGGRRTTRSAAFEAMLARLLREATGARAAPAGDDGDRPAAAAGPDSTPLPAVPG